MSPTQGTIPAQSASPRAAAFRAAVAEAYSTPPGLVEERYLTALSKYDPARVARMMRFGDPEIGDLRQTTGARARLGVLAAAERAARIGAGLSPESGPSQPRPQDRILDVTPIRPIRTIGGMDVESLRRSEAITFAADPAAFLERWNRVVESSARARNERGQALRADTRPPIGLSGRDEPEATKDFRIAVPAALEVNGSRGPAARTAALETAHIGRPAAFAANKPQQPPRPGPEQIRNAWDKAREQLARQTAILPRSRDELADRTFELAPEVEARLLRQQMEFREALRHAYVDPKEAEKRFHRFAAADRAGVDSVVMGDLTRLGALRPGADARTMAEMAAVHGGQAYRIHLAQTPMEALLAVRRPEPETPAMADRKIARLEPVTPLDYVSAADREPDKARRAAIDKQQQVCQAIADKHPEAASVVAHAKKYVACETIAGGRAPHDRAMASANGVLKLIARDDSLAAAASSALDRQFARHYRDPAAARARFDQSAGRRSAGMDSQAPRRPLYSDPVVALKELTDAPESFGALKRRISPEERLELYGAAREAIRAGITADSQLPWQDPAGRMHLTRAATRTAATDTLKAAAKAIDDTSTRLSELGGLGENRRKTLEAFAQLPPQLRLQLAGPFARAMPALGLDLQKRSLGLPERSLGL